MNDMEIRRNLAKFIADFPDLHDELFKQTEPMVRTQVFLNSGELGSTAVVKLWDRARELSKDRVHAAEPTLPRCQDKDSYTEVDARLRANDIWNRSKVEMRVFKCSVCTGYHLTNRLER